MSKSFFLKTSILCFLIISFTFPGVASADEFGSSMTVTTPKVREEQAASNEAPVEFNKDYFKGYGTDFKSMVTSPARWDTADWITATLVTGAAVGLYENDSKIMKWVQDHKTTTTNNIGDVITDFGHGKFTPVILGGMYLYGHVADDGKMRKTVLLSVESFVLTGVFVQTIKYTTHRHRPYTGDPPHTFDGPSLHGTSSNSSLPSGHASSAFAVAAVIASEYDNIIVPPLAYGIAAITALNRVSHNAHWPSDAFLAAAIGYFTGKAIVASHRNVKKSDLSFTPIISDGGMGMTLTYRF
ncbi:MAG: phosphatase PAP2 family protein [Nitrospirae bacterium]|nr:phosphatase PAP2 family protein [Nitrospirota bacterium]